MSAPGRLSGKVAIVTGGGQGFGRAIAAKFIDEGATVVIADFHEETGQRTASELKCTFRLVDVTKLGDWEALADSVLQQHGQIDIVVNNAGTTYRNKPSEHVEDAEFDLCFNVNVKSIFYSSKVMVPRMIQGGRSAVFVNIASTAGLRPRPGLTWYNASKAAVINATKTLAVEYAKHHIRFVSVCPVVALGTGLTELFLGEKKNEKAFMDTVPLGRGATPADVANATCFIASEEAAFITGNAIEVDGGRCV